MINNLQSGSKKIAKMALFIKPKNSLTSSKLRVQAFITLYFRHYAL